MNFSEPTIRLNKIMSRNASVGIFRLWRICPHLPLTSELDTAAWGMRSGFVKPVSRATSQAVLRIYDALTCIIYTQEYRSGHNEAVLKTVCPKGTGVRIPLPAPIKMVYSLRVDLFLLPQSEGTNPKGSHTAAAEYITRSIVFAVSASRGDVGLNLYRSGTVFTNLTPSSIPLFKRGF